MDVTAFEATEDDQLTVTELYEKLPKDVKALVGVSILAGRHVSTLGVQTRLLLKLALFLRVCYECPKLPSEDDGDDGENGAPDGDGEEHQSNDAAFHALEEDDSKDSPAPSHTGISAEDLDLFETSQNMPNGSRRSSYAIKDHPRSNVGSTRPSTGASAFGFDLEQHAASLAEASKFAASASRGKRKSRSSASHPPTQPAHLTNERATAQAIASHQQSRRHFDGRYKRTTQSTNKTSSSADLGKHSHSAKPSADPQAPHLRAAMAARAAREGAQESRREGVTTSSEFPLAATVASAPQSPRVSIRVKNLVHPKDTPVDNTRNAHSTPATEEHPQAEALGRLHMRASDQDQASNSDPSNAKVRKTLLARRDYLDAASSKRLSFDTLFKMERTECSRKVAAAVDNSHESRRNDSSEESGDNDIGVDAQDPSSQALLLTECAKIKRGIEILKTFNTITLPKFVKPLNGLQLQCKTCWRWEHSPLSSPVALARSRTLCTSCLAVDSRIDHTRKVISRLSAFDLTARVPENSETFHYEESNDVANEDKAEAAANTNHSRMSSLHSLSEPPPVSDSEFNPDTTDFKPDAKPVVQAGYYHSDLMELDLATLQTGVHTTTASNPQEHSSSLNAEALPFFVPTSKAPNDETAVLDDSDTRPSLSVLKADALPFFTPSSNSKGKENIQRDVSNKHLSRTHGEPVPPALSYVTPPASHHFTWHPKVSASTTLYGAVLQSNFDPLQGQSLRHTGAQHNYAYSGVGYAPSPPPFIMQHASGAFLPVRPQPTQPAIIDNPQPWAMEYATGAFLRAPPEAIWPTFMNSSMQIPAHYEVPKMQAPRSRSLAIPIVKPAEADPSLDRATDNAALSSPTPSGQLLRGSSKGPPGLGQAKTTPQKAFDDLIASPKKSPIARDTDQLEQAFRTSKPTSGTSPVRHDSVIDRRFLHRNLPSSEASDLVVSTGNRFEAIHSIDVDNDRSTQQSPSYMSASEAEAEAGDESSDICPSTLGPYTESKGNRKRKKRAARTAVIDAWNQRETIRRRVAATYTLDGMRALEDATKAYDDKRSELASFAATNELVEEDALAFPKLLAGDLSEIRIRPKSNQSGYRKQKTKTVKKALTEHSTDAHFETPPPLAKADRDALAREAIEARQSYEEAYAIFDRPPPQGRSHLKDKRALGEIRIALAAKRYRAKCEAMEAAYPEDLPTELARQLWSYNDEELKKERDQTIGSVPKRQVMWRGGGRRGDGTDG